MLRNSTGTREIPVVRPAVNASASTVRLVTTHDQNGYDSIHQSAQRRAKRSGLDLLDLSLLQLFGLGTEIS